MSFQAVPPHHNLPARVPERAGHRLGERDRPSVAAAEDDDDDRRVHRRQRGREGADEDVEPPRDEVQLRRRLPDPGRLPDVPAAQGQGAAREEPVQELHTAHVLAARLRHAESGGAVPDDADAEPDAGGQRRGQRKDAGGAAGTARTLARRGQVPAAGRDRAEATGGHRQAQQRRSLAFGAEEDNQPAERQQDGERRHFQQVLKPGA